MTRRKLEGPKVRYAVVGAGWIAQGAFMPGVEHTGNSEMVALVTGDEEKARGLAKRYPSIRHTCGYDGYRALLERKDIDAVYLAVPNWMHREYAIPALEAGVALLLEKPSASGVADAEAIHAAAKRTGTPLMVAYRLHFEAGTLDAIRRVQSGEFGRVRMFNSTFSQTVKPGNHRAQHGFWEGPVGDMGPYPINAVRNLFAAEPTEVSARGVRDRSTGFDFDDTVSVTLRFPDERIAHFVVSYAAAGVNEYRVVGDKGDLHVAPGFTFGKGIAITHHATVDGKTTDKAFPETDQFGGETQYFSRCLLEGLEIEPDGEEGLADVRVIAAVQQSLESGAPVKLPPFERSKRPTPAQAVTLPPIEPPPMIHAKEPGED